MFSLTKNLKIFAALFFFYTIIFRYFLSYSITNQMPILKWTVAIIYGIIIFFTAFMLGKSEVVNTGVIYLGFKYGSKREGKEFPLTEEALEDMDHGRNIYNQLHAIKKERLEMGDYRGSEITIGYIGLCLAIQVQDPSYIEDSLEYFKKHKCDAGIKRIQEFEKQPEENKNEE